jgi:hypothetical protein
MAGGGRSLRRANGTNSPRVLSPSALEESEVHRPEVPSPRFVPLSAFLTLSGVCSFRNPCGLVSSHWHSWGSTTRPPLAGCPCPFQGGASFAFVAPTTPLDQRSFRALGPHGKARLRGASFSRAAGLNSRERSPLPGFPDRKVRVPGCRLMAGATFKELPKPQDRIQRNRLPDRY